MNFASDNAAGVAPEIIAAISRANDGATLAYGRDQWTRQVERRFAETFEREVAVFLVATGTAANALALAHLTPPWGAVLCHRESHIAADECGAPEFFGGGIKLVGLAGEAGKITPQTLRSALEFRSMGRPPPRQPRRAVALPGDRSRHHLSHRRDPRARRPRPRARVGGARRRRPARQCARAYECIAGAGDLAGGRRRAVVRRNQGRRARSRSGRVLRSGACRGYAGAAQARRPSRFQASLPRRSDRGVSRPALVAEAGTARQCHGRSACIRTLRRRHCADLAGRGERGVRRAAVVGRPAARVHGRGLSPLEHGRFACRYFIAAGRRAGAPGYLFCNDCRGGRSVRGGGTCLRDVTGASNLRPIPGYR